MATKTISLELDAYEKLKAAKLDPRESFSSVVRRASWERSHFTGQEVIEYMERLRAAGELLSEEALDRLDRAQDQPRRSESRWADR